jgi:hypothetical protein
MPRALLILLLCTLLCGCEEANLSRVETEHPCRDCTRMVFGGDLDYGNSYMKWEVEAGREDILESRGHDYGLEKLAPLLRGADVVVVNLETPLTDIPESPWAGQKHYIHYNHPVRAPASMKRHNIGAVSLANNHALDYGVPGLEQTFTALAREGIAWFGAGMNEAEAARPLLYRAATGNDTVTVLVAGGFEYARWYDRAFHFFARDDTAGANNWTIDRAAADVRRLRGQYPDAFIITFPHWGKNYWWKIRRQRAMAQAMIDAGADLILGHGAHLIQEVESYRGRWIVYSLGNLHFNSPGRYRLFGKDPYSFVAALDVDAGTRAFRLRLYPIVSDNLITDYQPRPVEEGECDTVERLLLRQAALPRELRRHMGRGHDQYGLYFELDVSPATPGR